MTDEPHPPSGVSPAPTASPELDAWLRRAVATTPGKLLGSGYQASVLLYSGPWGDVVVKQPHESVVFGALWRRLIRREHDVYTRLRGIPGIPRSFGLIDGRYLALEYVAGPSLRTHEGQLAEREGFFAALLATVRAMHAAGVAHGDLKRKNNIVVGAGERPYIVDFGIATRHDDASASRLGRLWFDHAKQADYNAWVKLKYGRRIDPADVAEVLSPADAELYRPLWTERLARAIRVPWQKITLRRPRQRWRKRRDGE